MTRAQSPHPEIQAFLEQMDAIPSPTISALSPEGARRFSEQMFAPPDDSQPVGDVMELLIPGPEGQIPIRVYIPDRAGPFPALVYYHGGGWVIGSLDTYDETCRTIASQADCMVISVDYGLAPEHRFPEPVVECYAAAEWVIENADSLQIDPERIAVGGDSAGGNLAAAVTQMARERDGPTFAHQVLVYPVTDYSFETDSYEENGDGYLLTREAMEWFWDQYLESPIDGQNPYASPLRARDLSNLPPATVLTCGFDPLRDEGIAYADRLREAGVDVNHVNYDDAIHGIVQMLAEPDLTRARDLISDVSEDLRSAFE